MILFENEPITVVGNAELDPADLSTALSHAPIIVAADGGADHVFRADLIPAAVIGDLDSISDLAREMFADRLHQIAEQETTDFEKVLLNVEAPAYVCVGFHGGRLDHSMAVLNTLGLHSDKRIILLGADEVAFAVADSSLSIEVGEGAAVSVLPLGPCTATTLGLVWDLNALNMQLGKAISSSNRAADNKVQISIEGKAIVTVPKAALPAAITAVRGE